MNRRAFLAALLGAPAVAMAAKALPASFCVLESTARGMGDYWERRAAGLPIATYSNLATWPPLTIERLQEALDELQGQFPERYSWALEARLTRPARVGERDRGNETGAVIGDRLQISEMLVGGVERAELIVDTLHTEAECLDHAAVVDRQLARWDEDQF